METQELHRGRLIDHIQLVVRDLSAAQRFYTAIFESLSIPIGGTGDVFFGQTNYLSRRPKVKPRRGC
jgi:catechol 2,3-dioxygenase-like lactoylglutathione lyase family enzyme